jgi:hypothetical protein
MNAELQIQKVVCDEQPKLIVCISSSSQFNMKAEIELPLIEKCVKNTYTTKF